MTTALAILLIVHAVIHLLGTAKAFNWAEIPALAQPITPALGAIWLLAALFFGAAAVSLYAFPRIWWLIALCAVALSMTVIVTSWADAKAGTAPNLVVLAAVAVHLATGRWR